MPARYPEPTDGYPVITLKDTDKSLSLDARIQNNMRYMYFKTIAQGGKCVIQSCKDLYLGRVICYKTLRAEIADDEMEQKRFLREARVTAMLQHPNTPPVYELGRDTSGRYYFTMKLIAGVTLRELLDQLREGDKEFNESWYLERLIDVLIQVLQALDYAHAHGVVHRDIKPENILVGRFGEVLLLDWGLAKVWDEKRVPQMEGSGEAVLEEDLSLTAGGPIQATPLYMSPEQITASPNIDHRTDIYSLGSVLFEMLTLEHMAWGETLDELLDNTQNRPAPLPSLVSPDREIPSLLETLCLRCVQKDPDHRIQSVREMIHELLYWKRLQAVSYPFF